MDVNIDKPGSEDLVWKVVVPRVCGQCKLLAISHREDPFIIHNQHRLLDHGCGCEKPGRRYHALHKVEVPVRKYTSLKITIPAFVSCCCARFRAAFDCLSFKMGILANF